MPEQPQPPSPESAPVTDVEAEAWASPLQTLPNSYKRQAELWKDRTRRLCADRARDQAQAELDRTEIQAYSELLDEIAKATGAEDYIEAVVLVTRAQARIEALEEGIAETIAACERQDFRIFEQLTVADVLKPLLKEVPDAKS